MTVLTADSFTGVVSQRMAAEAIALSGEWLTRLRDVVPMAANDVFPSDDILDHIPALIESIARYVYAPEDEAIAANTIVIDKARELGELRHRQKASVHQILREFEILGELLEGFVAREAERMPVPPPGAECVEALRRVTRASRAILRTTVDTFVAEYTAAIKERNERLTLFHRMASHEIRTPLGSLMFAAAALDHPAVRADHSRIDRIAEAIRNGTERLNRLVENLQRIARIADSNDAPNLQRIEIGAIAAEAARQVAEMAAVRGVEIRIAADLPCAMLDPARLELILLNLLSNAIKYSDPHKPSPFVAVEAMPRTSGPLLLTVRDNGLGVPAEMQGTIFDRFTRAHARLDEELGVSGTGLGLSIVAECVEALGGVISCESTVGEGTTFVIELPSNAADSVSNP